jgi:fibronectin-binding autotransporter adhesin
MFAAAALVMSTSRAEAAVRTWRGTNSGLWNVAANWGGTLPVAGDDLLFPNGALNRAMTNDFAAGTSFHSLTFQDYYSRQSRSAA